MILALGSFATKVSAARLLTNEDGLPVSIVALNNEPLVFSLYFLVWALSFTGGGINYFQVFDHFRLNGRFADL